MNIINIMVQMVSQNTYVDAVEVRAAGDIGEHMQVEIPPTQLL